MVLEQQNGYTSLHSCSRRPTLPQVAAYLMIITMNIAFWACIQKHFANSATRFVMISLFSVSLVVLLLTGIITSILDPSDSILQQYRSGNSEVQTRPLVRYRRHLDQCLYCDFCRSYVLQSSRHCKQCDRCIKKFDHHCIWINNCIGDFNYCEFIAMIFSALVHLLLYIIAVGLLWSQDSWRGYLGEMIFIWIIWILAILFSIMVSGLIALHMYLIYNGMTTFEYILSKKTMSQRMKFATPIKSKQDEQHPRPTSQHFQTLDHEVTQNNYQPSAFGEVTLPHQLERSEIPSGQYLKQNKNKQFLPKITPFQIIELKKEDQQDQHLQQLYRSNRSLKLLVGNSVKVKERKSSVGSSNESHSYRSKSRKIIDQSLKSDKYENVINIPVKYYKEEESINEDEIEKTK